MACKLCSAEKSYHTCSVHNDGPFCDFDYAKHLVEEHDYVLWELYRWAHMNSVDLDSMRERLREEEVIE